MFLHRFRKTAATPALGAASTIDIAPVRGQDVLEKLAALPISTWNYKADDASVRHMGPMAQDFAAAFGLGSDDRTINLLDANGVVMVAIQALHRRVLELEAELATLRDSRGDSDA